MTGELGKASLDITANLSDFRKNVALGKHDAGDFKDSLDALAAVAKISEDALNRVKMSPGQAAESKTSAEGILSGVRGISEQARTAARELDRVRISEAQATESDAAGDRIKRNLDDIKDDAGKAERALDRVKLRLAAARLGAGGVGSNRPGYGVGPFGAGYGRLGVVGTAVAAGAITAPAAVPAAAGLLASIPTLAAGGIGVLGTLALALDGVGKALGGDKKAFDDLTPSAQAFVQTVRSLDDWFDKLRETAAKGLFPGVTEGLKSALTPGTVAAITAAVSVLAVALGHAAAEWGHFIGSPEFQQILGPLMAAAAQNIGLISDAALHLFDALGILARGAIPFTSWLMHAADSGARLADSWLHAKDASGALGGALHEAQASLRLVGGLAVALLHAVFALGKALYPVAKVAVKDLTDGLNALARIIQQNQGSIRAFVSGALSALVATVKIAWPIVRTLASALGAVVKAMGGWKTAFAFIISGFLATKFLALGKSVIGIGGAAATAEGKVGGLRGMLLALGSPEVLAAIAAAAAAYIAFRALTESTVGQPVNIGPQSIQGIAARDRGRLAAITGQRKTLAEKVANLRAGGLTDAQIKARLEKGYSGTSGRDLVVDQALVDASLLTKYAYGPQLLTLPTSIQHMLAAAANVTGSGAAAAQKKAYQAAVSYYDSLLNKPGETKAQKTAILNERAQYVQALAATSTSVFGTPPPFTKNVGSGTGASSIPAGAAHALSLASANASKASVLGNVGKAARKYLNAELGDLQTADKLIKTKYESATGKARTSLFAALTSVENKMREVRKRLGKAIGDSRAAELQFAVDQAKEAVAAATVGSSAYDRAVAAEEKALKRQIAYLDKIAKNSKLSLAARTKAIRAEAADERQLKSLLKTTAVNNAANIAQFLTSFADITKSFDGNAFPTGSGSKTDTHLFDIKNELRDQTPYIKKAARSNDFPATGYALATAGVMAG